MSSDVAVEVRGLGKRYEIGADQGSYMLLTERVTQRVKSLGRRQPTEEFWALRDIDFELERGKTLGIIGHNGAGKSTLLKILSRITPPTEGEARLRGRVGALLEVGTGFHPELTGRENVFLNGAILNMKRQEIQRRFDEIVDFADIGPFIDTPVKRYSSGMQLRLAFSVAAHLEPEILIIDEVLSVGDLNFQQKCLGRMETASREGRTVVFISHNLPSVMNLCDEAIMLSEGRITATGRVADVIDHYVEDVSSDIERGLRDRKNRFGNGKLRMVDARFERDGRVVDIPASGEDFEIVFAFEKHTKEALRGARFNFSIHILGDGTPLLDLDSGITGTTFQEIPEHGEIRCRIDRCPLPAGQYYIDVRADGAGERYDAVHHAAELTVAGGDFYGSGAAQDRIMDYRTVLVDHSWTMEAVPESGTPDATAAPSALA
ncbi:MAG TPA: ABC transporter ATP-binding protein [Solirubrobacterales bacterium]|nr:ABC transporter ATP-binding protein [Solirubrobacterales bacterium]